VVNSRLRAPQARALGHERTSGLQMGSIADETTAENDAFAGPLDSTIGKATPSGGGNTVARVVRHGDVSAALRAPLAQRDPSGRELCSATHALCCVRKRKRRPGAEPDPRSGAHGVPDARCGE
jgi:hypothetical protein